MEQKRSDVMPATEVELKLASAVLVWAGLVNIGKKFVLTVKDQDVQWFYAISAMGREKQVTDCGM